MSSRVVSLSREADIAILTVDNPPVNTIGADVRRDLSSALSELGEQSDVRAVVLVAEGSTFCSGADIAEFDGPPKEAEFRELFARVEGLSVPVVAGLHGTVLGGGLELALACHYRVAVRGTRLGLPEVSLGIIPGAGGTQRMPRLIGVEKTLELILGVRPVDADAALEMGFVDQVCDGSVRDATLEFARSLVATDTGPRRTFERSVDPATGTPEILERLRSEARERYPNRTAPLTAIEAVSASLHKSFGEGLLYEEQLANEAKATPEAKALVHAFFAERRTRKVPELTDDVRSRTVERGGVVGGGTMGRGIALCFANAGLPVTVVEADDEALARGMEGIAGILESRVRRGRIDEAERDRLLALIKASTRYADLADADVIVEAVFEDMALKRQVFRELDAVAKAGALLATNTSTLDIEEIASATSRPEDVIGLHFFSPANVMPLLEVVRAERTSPVTLRTALDLAKPLRKTPVVAKVCYGFIGNRMMEGYAREAERMVLEGATPRQVDTALERFGMAMGILAVFDMAGVDVGVKVHRANADRYPPDPTYYQADVALYEAGRLGQKSGAGYYRYDPGDRTRHDDPEALRILRAAAQRLGVEPRAHGGEELVERCLYPLLNEGFRILEEGIAIRASDIDVVWCAGYGFPRYRGGPMFYADAIGLGTLYEGMLRYRDLFGPMHWEPAPLLAQLVAEGRTLADWSETR
jgi:3-hydroxyacyl-CoA dehydrogenase